MRFMMSSSTPSMDCNRVWGSDATNTVGLPLAVLDGPGPIPGGGADVAGGGSGCAIGRRHAPGQAR